MDENCRNYGCMAKNAMPMRPSGELAQQPQTPRDYAEKGTETYAGDVDDVKKVLKEILGHLSFPERGDTYER